MIDDALICWHCPGECDDQFDNGIFIHCDDAPNVRCLFQHIQHKYAGHGINQFIRHIIVNLTTSMINPY